MCGTCELKNIATQTEIYATLALTFLWFTMSVRTLCVQSGVLAVLMEFRFTVTEPVSQGALNDSNATSSKELTVVSRHYIC
jgi:hypothetical protein